MTNLDTGLVVSIIVYAVLLGLWAGRMQMTISSHAELLKEAKDKLDKTDDILSKVLSELTRLSTLIEERTSKRNTP